MADDQTQPQVTAATVQTDVISLLRAEQNAIAEAARIAEEKQLDETVEGGAYKRPDGSWVNANGEPISKPKGMK